MANEKKKVFGPITRRSIRRHLAVAIEVLRTTDRMIEMLSDDTDVADYSSRTAIGNIVECAKETLVKVKALLSYDHLDNEEDVIELMRRAIYSPEAETPDDNRDEEPVFDEYGEPVGILRRRNNHHAKRNSRSAGRQAAQVQEVGQ